MFFISASLLLGGRFADQESMAQRGRWLGLVVGTDSVGDDYDNLE
jgi:hypothetical protein